MQLHFFSVQLRLMLLARIGYTLSPLQGKTLFSSAFKFFQKSVLYQNHLPMPFQIAPILHFNPARFRFILCNNGETRVIKLNYSAILSLEPSSYQVVLSYGCIIFNINNIYIV